MTDELETTEYEHDKIQQIADDEIHKGTLFAALVAALLRDHRKVLSSRTSGEREKDLLGKWGGALMQRDQAAEEMRERAARWHEREAREWRAAGQHPEADPQRCWTIVEIHEASAAAIRALPLSPPGTDPTIAQTGASMETLGRFDHHPDPATDFCVEVDAIEGFAAEVRVGMRTREFIVARIAKAMQFVVGGDIQAVNAKAILRRLEAEFKSPAAPASPAREKAQRIGEDVAAEWDYGYSGLGNDGIAKIAAEGARRGAEQATASEAALLQAHAKGWNDAHGSMKVSPALLSEDEKSSG